MRNTVFILFLFSVVVFSQQPLDKISPVLNSILSTTQANEEVLVWVFFKDKGNELQKYYSIPENVVSKRSLTRRLKTGNGSLLDEDLPVNQDYISQVTSRGLKIKNKSKWFNGVSGYIKKSNLNSILSFNFITKIDAVAKLKKDSKEKTHTAKNDKGFEKLNKTLLDYGESLTQLQQINVPAIHNLGYTGQNVTICVMDAGFNRLSHEAFSTMNIIAAWDFVNGDPDVGNGSDMGDGSHGTQTLSTIGGYKSGKLIGPAFSSDYILAKTENTDSETPIEEDNWIAALEWADSIGVDVTSTSLGYLDYDPPYVSYTWQDMDGNTALITIAADLAVKKGISVFNSAGNNGYNSSHNTLGAPADGDSVMSIGAVYSSGQRVDFSSVGNTIDGRIKPDVMAMGSDVVVASPWSNTGYTYSSGTSFSCPLAAGVAALLLSYNPNLTPMQIRDAIRNTASNNANPNREYGWGVINSLLALEYFPVPVELISFRGKFINGKIILDWQTATELNNYGFEIQFLDKNEWITAVFVKGNGTSSNLNSYSVTLAPYNEGINIYRIKQLDYDGKISYSSQIEIDATLVTAYQLFQNYPNPFNPVTTIRFSVPEEEFTRIELFDVTGNKISELYKGIAQPGSHEFALNAADLNLSSGFYVVNFRSGKYNKSIKIMLMK